MYTWTTAGFLPYWDLKGLLYLFEIYSKSSYFDFPMRFCETCATTESVFTCYAVPDKTNVNVNETWILPFYVYPTFAWASTQLG